MDEVVTIQQEEIHVLGDANFNWKQLNENQGTTNNAIVEATKDIILSQGVTQCVKKDTRQPQGNQNHKPAILDHFYTTVPDKLKILMLCTLDLVITV